MATSLKPGDPAPDFDGITTDGKHVSLKDFRGRKLVLYFYPKDDTPGCTRQACSLRDHNAELAAKGAAVLGVSTRTLQEWEQGRRAPSGAARTLLLIASKNPRVLIDVA